MNKRLRFSLKILFDSYTKKILRDSINNQYIEFVKQINLDDNLSNLQYIRVVCNDTNPDINPIALNVTFCYNLL